MTRQFCEWERAKDIHERFDQHLYQRTIGEEENKTRVEIRHLFKASVRGGRGHGFETYIRHIQF